MSGPRPVMRERIVQHLADFGPATAREIAAGFGVHPQVIYNAINRTRKHAPGTLRVASWQRTKKHPAAVWGLGDKRDAPPPVPITAAESCRASRQRFAAVHRARRKPASWLPGLL
jgi:hypothetical protein